MAAPQATINQLAAALRYATLGWRVVPLHAPIGDKCSCERPECRGGGKQQKSIGKHPRMSNWQEVATTDAKLIREWFTRWPDANVGIATGRASGLLGLDVDPDKGGEQTLAALLAKHGAFAKTVEAMTGSGGRHLLFRHPGGKIPNGTDRLGPGLDIRSDGGQMVVAPSMHRNGRAYEWQHECEPGTDLADAPAWLLDMACPPAQQASPPLPRNAQISSAYDRARAYLAKMDPAVEGQNGSKDEFKAAVVLIRGFRLSEAEAFSLLLSEYNPRCVPPWSEKETRHKIADAISKSTLPYGWIVDRESRPQPPRQSPSRQPGEDDGDEASAPKKPRFKLEKLTDLLLEQIPPTKWLLAPYIPAASFGELVGPPGKGKTTFMAWTIAQMAKAGVRCAVVEEEGSRKGLQRLLGRASEAVGGGIEVHFLHAQSVNLLNALDVRALAETLRGFDFCLFDSFNLVTPGLDEDKALAMGPVIQDIRWLRDSLKLAVWFNHHSGKSKWKPGEKPRLGDGRGSSAWPGALDAELSMKPLENPEEGFIQFELYVTKMREGDDQVIPKRVSIARNGPAAVLEMSDLIDSAPQADAHLALAVLEYLRAAGPDGASKNAIEKKVDGDNNAKRAALQALKYSGTVEEIPHGKYTKWRVR